MHEQNSILTLLQNQSCCEAPGGRQQTHHHGSLMCGLLSEDCEVLLHPQGPQMVLLVTALHRC